jgi:LysB family phage lysis regulatory protein
MGAVALWALKHYKSVVFILVSLVLVSLLGAVQYFQKDAELARSQLEIANDRVKTYRGANEAQRLALAQLAASQAAEEDIARRISERLDAIAAQNLDTSSKLEELSRNNAQIRDYLNVPVPDDVRRLLGERPAPGRVRTPGN